MQGYLKKEQIEYIFYHLEHHCLLNDEIRSAIVFFKEEDDPDGFADKLVFRMSSRAFSTSEVSWINEIPLFFSEGNDESFCKQTGDNIIFAQDILKSAFYLLSGYQETDKVKTDSLGRYPFTESVQSKLGFTAKPVVNYYFEEIIKGIESFCQRRKLEFKRLRLSQNFIFFLTHDVDRIVYYTFNTFLYTIKQLFGYGKPVKSKTLLLKNLITIGINIITGNRKNDPYWNFEYLSDLEISLKIKSSWFFLPKDQKHVDSFYKLSEKRITSLINYLMHKGHDICLHGTVRSHQSFDNLKKIVDEFLSITQKDKTGMRQHRLMWENPETAIIQDKAGILFDSTLGFADHEGFRNSYCHPFRLYDFRSDSMLSVWEIPLNVMDATLFHYRRLSSDDAYNAIESLMDEICKFGGVFTLLWHNSYLLEKDIPGINKFYKNLLTEIMRKDPEVLSGGEIIMRMP